MTPPNGAAGVLLGLSEKEAASVTASKGKRKVATPAAGPAIGSGAGPSGVKRGWESDSETETDSVDSASGVACGLCGVHQVQSSPSKGGHGSPAQKKAKRECAICFTHDSSQWHGAGKGSDGVEKSACDRCYRWARKEAVSRAYPGLKCSSCGKDTTSVKWYGVGTDHVKCQSCYCKAQRESVKQSHPDLKCSSCGRDKTGQWYGVGTDSVKCKACYLKARKADKKHKESNLGLRCSTCGRDTTSQWYGVGTDSVKCRSCYDKAWRADKKQREKMQNITEEPEPAVDPPCDAGNGGNEASPSDGTEQGTLPVAAEQRPARAEGGGGTKANKRFSQRFLLDAEVPNKLYLRFAPGMGGLPTLKNPYVKLLRMTPVRKVVSTLFKKLPEDSHRLNEPEDLELLSNTDVLPLGMTMSALLQGEGGAHKPPRCEWRRSVENGVEVEKVIIDVSYRARRVEPKESPIVIED